MPILSQPGEPVEWIKAKYLLPNNGYVGKRCRADYAGHSNKRRIHRILTPAERERHARQPFKVKHLLPNGKFRMEIRERPGSDVAIQGL